LSKRSLIYVACFAIGGFLLALWDMKLNFDPLPWEALRYFLSAACFEIPLLFWFSGHLGRSLLLWPLTTAGIYAVAGAIICRAARRQLPRVRQPAARGLVARCVLYFGAFGYVVVLWNNGLNLAPLHGEILRGLFRDACLTCVNDSHGTLWGDLLLGGPVNAALFASLGWLVGRALRSWGAGADLSV
jgi:hypothetical protein